MYVSANLSATFSIYRCMFLPTCLRPFPFKDVYFYQPVCESLSCEPVELSAFMVKLLVVRHKSCCPVRMLKRVEFSARQICIRIPKTVGWYCRMVHQIFRRHDGEMLKSASFASMLGQGDLCVKFRDQNQETVKCKMAVLWTLAVAVYFGLYV
jgi:hypothetical protein